uniref:Trypsin-1 n=1 Tax=Lygus hesperus TaxID=30085 RepID=A0A0A9VXI6_LYGHE
MECVRICLLSIAALFSTICAADVPYCGLTNADPFSDRIVGGIESIPHEFPWMVKLKKKNTFYCGAALIADKYVLTAGHCVCLYEEGTPREPKAVRGNIVNYYLFQAADIKAELGSHTTVDKDPNLLRQVTGIILHPEYDVFLSNGIMIQTNDLALLKIPAVQFSTSVIPICLPNQGDRVPDNSVVIVAGWGSTNTETVEDKVTKLPDVLMKTALIKIPWETCRKNPNVGIHLEPANNMNDKEIFCLIGNNTDACRGDSGGPAVVYTVQGFVVAGIVSWGIGCNQINYPAAYTQVSSYVDFIQSSSKDGVYLPKRPWM